MISRAGRARQAPYRGPAQPTQRVDPQPILNAIGSKLTLVMDAGQTERARVNIEKAVKVARAVKSTELLVEFENR